MSAICQNFVQNTWKKELCSNCFKSKSEHVFAPIKNVIVDSSNNKKTTSIIRSKTDEKSKTKQVVSFKSEISKVIGYGGEDWSEGEPESTFTDQDEQSDEQDSVEYLDEERELQKLTKENTEFNSIKGNLLLAEGDRAIKKSFAQLKLGTPQVDAQGRKQTLMVSVTPFGHENSANSKKTEKISSHIPVAKNKDSLLENKNSAVLTSYTSKKTDFVEEKSLLEEISETLENSKTPIQIISPKKNATRQNDNRSSPLSKISSTYLLEAAAERSSEKIKDLRAGRLPAGKGITRAPVIKKKDQEKPAIYQTSVAKLEFSRNINNNNPTENKNFKFNLKENEKLSENESNGSSSLLDKSSDNFIDDDSSNESGNSLTESLAGERAALESSDSIETSLSISPSQSREQVGDPDGHSNPDDLSLSSTPPPRLVETRSSFLHGSINNEDPKQKSTVKTEKKLEPTHHQILPQSVSEENAPQNLTSKLLQDINGTDSVRIGNKRQAPKPPSIEQAINQFNSSISTDSIERASSCSPQLNGLHNSVPTLPQRTISLSTDNLLITTANLEEKKKDKGKQRFSLKRFLRINSNKDISKVRVEPPKYEEVNFVDSQTKPRLVIVHPLDLNGQKVEVLSSTQTTLEEVMERPEPKLPNKPPPPPRTSSENSSILAKGRPNLPHPPRLLTHGDNKKFPSRREYLKSRNDSVYANIGEVRSAIVPNKPQRTASMREREALAQEQNYHAGVYEPINISNERTKENVYDYITHDIRSNSPECNGGNNYSSDCHSVMPAEKSRALKNLRQGRSNSHMDVSGGDFFKFQNIPRSASLTYCGSETESEIYAPQSFCGSESEIAEEEHEWILSNGKPHKLRFRKGRSIVHKNLEDNYGAVIIANHEALAQVLENIQQGPPIQPALRGLKTAPNLRWTDFSIKENLSPLTLGNRIFHQAVWGAHHITLAITTSSAPTTSISLGTFNLIPITEFTDLVPAKYSICEINKEPSEMIQSSISVFPWLQLNTIQSYAELLKSKQATSNQEEINKDAYFIILQLINALKIIQAQGIEELPLSLNSFVICKDVERDVHFRLCVLQGLGEEFAQKKEDVEFGSLCLCASTVVVHLLSNSKITQLLKNLLSTERAISLSQVKSVLEFSLWGPSDVNLSFNIKERELTLQRWLDLQRATVLHGLVCARIHLTVYEECHLLFLVRSNAKMMCDASLLLDSINKQISITNGGRKQ